MKPFDERLYALKLQGTSRQMRGDSAACLRRARAEVKQLGNQARFFPALIECEIEAGRKYVEAVDRVCRDVWLLDGNAITPDFIRSILVPRVFRVIAVRKGTIQHPDPRDKSTGSRDGEPLRG